ncbi:MAG: pilus assembly protein [Proteobacteria bacterium]|nr:pilus assembly protein [Pseudomonadota bacterium]
MSRKNHRLFRLVRGREGAAAVEFAIVLNLLLLLLMGMIDFGHAWFLKQVITNASREGARVGVVYPHLVMDIPATVISGVKDHLPGTMGTDPELNIDVKVGSGLTADPLTVTVTYTKTWWIINYFLPGMGDSTQIWAQTVMRYE